MKRLLAVGFIFLIIAAGFGCSTKNKTINFQKKPVLKRKTYLPDKLAGLNLTTKITGTQAIKMINQMHMGAKIAIKKAYIAYYSKGSQRAGAIVWVSVTDSKKNNQILLDRMTEKINTGKSPFSKPVEKKVQGVKVYSLTGMGQNHYYFINGKKFIWLAVDKNNTKNALDQLIKSMK